jgi:hypothetical protein
MGRVYTQWILSDSKKIFCKGGVFSWSVPKSTISYLNWSIVGFSVPKIKVSVLFSDYILLLTKYTWTISNRDCIDVHMVMALLMVGASVSIRVHCWYCTHSGRTGNWNCYILFTWWKKIDVFKYEQYCILFVSKRDPFSVLLYIILCMHIAITV